MDPISITTFAGGAVKTGYEIGHRIHEQGPNHQYTKGQNILLEVKQIFKTLNDAGITWRQYNELAEIQNNLIAEGDHLRKYFISNTGLSHPVVTAQVAMQVREWVQRCIEHRSNIVNQSSVVELRIDPERFIASAERMNAPLPALPDAAYGRVRESYHNNTHGGAQGIHRGPHTSANGAHHGTSHAGAHGARHSSSQAGVHGPHHSSSHAGAHSARHSSSQAGAHGPYPTIPHGGAHGAYPTPHEAAQSTYPSSFYGRTQGTQPSSSHGKAQGGYPSNSHGRAQSDAISYGAVGYGYQGQGNKGKGHTQSAYKQGSMDSMSSYYTAESHASGSSEFY